MVKKEEKDERAAHTFREVTWSVGVHTGGITGNYADFALFYFLPRSCSWGVIGGILILILFSYS